MTRALAIALALSGAVGCTRAPERPRHILLVTIDTARADRYGCYGRAGAGTPVLDALAARGTRFADASAPTPITLPSHVTLFTGIEPARHGVHHNGLYALPDAALTLAEALDADGFATGAFVASVALSRRHRLDQGFDSWTEPGLGGSALFLLAERDAFAVNVDALAWYRERLGEEENARTFAWVHYMEPHFPYAPPDPERARFASDLYQGEIAAADRALGELLTGLEGLGCLDDTLVVVASDHGEDLGDHGEQTHGIFLYQSTIAVPLVVAGPGARSGAVVTRPVGLVDVTPTLLSALGLALPADLDGHDLWPVVAHGEPLAEGREIYLETHMPRLDYGWSELRGVRQGRSKYVQAPRPELYDLEADPRESRDLVGAQPEQAGALDRAVDGRLARAERLAMDAPERVDLTPQEREALESLGYVAGGAASPTGPLPDPKDRLPEVFDLERADGALRSGRVDEAESLLRDLVVRNPRFTEARLSLLTVNLVKGDVEAAQAEVAAIDAALAGSVEGARVAARAHLVLSEAFFRAGRVAEALAEITRALAAPMPVEVHVRHAELLAASGDLVAARQVLDRLRVDGELTPEGVALAARIGS